MSRLAPLRLAHLFGYDVFIERGCTSLTDGRATEFLPAFGAVRTCDGVEVWGLGLHAVVSRLA